MGERVRSSTLHSTGWVTASVVIVLQSNSLKSIDVGAAGCGQKIIVYRDGLIWRPKVSRVDFDLYAAHAQTPQAQKQSILTSRISVDTKRFHSCWGVSARLFELRMRNKESV